MLSLPDLAGYPAAARQLTCPVCCRADDMSLCTYGLLACSAFSAQPCELKLRHAAIKGGKVTKAGEPWWALDLP